MKPSDQDITWAFAHYENNLDETVGLSINQNGELVEVISSDLILKINGIFADIIIEAGDGVIILDYIHEKQ